MLVTRAWMKAALLGALMASLLSAWFLLLAWRHKPLLGLAVTLAVALGGAAIGAGVAVLYQALGRLKLWTLVLALSLTSLAIVVSTTDPRSGSTLLIDAALCLSSALSLWVLSAYGLHVALRARRDARADRARP